MKHTVWDHQDLKGLSDLQLERLEERECRRRKHLEDMVFIVSIPATILIIASMAFVLLIGCEPPGVNKDGDRIEGDSVIENWANAVRTVTD